MANKELKIFIPQNTTAIIFTLVAQGVTEDNINMANVGTFSQKVGEDCVGFDFSHGYSIEQGFQKDAIMMLSDNGIESI